MDIKTKIKILKNKILTLGLAASSLVPSGSADAKKPMENSFPEANTEAISSSSEDRSDSLMKTETTAFYKSKLSLADVKSRGVYKGAIEVDFANCDPHQLGWVFESGMDAGIVDPSNSYIGLFQMDLGGTMTAFLKTVKNKYPKLAQLGANVHNRKPTYKTVVRNGKEVRVRQDSPFVKEWKRLDSDEFRKAQSDFMEAHKYAPVFAEIRKIEELNIDQRGDALHGAICSAINQLSSKVVVNLVRDAFEKAKSQSQNGEASTYDVIENFYDLRTARAPRLKSRFQGVTKNGKKIVFGEKDMALDYQKYLEATHSLQKNNDLLSELQTPDIPPLKTDKLEVKNIAPLPLEAKNFVKNTKSKKVLSKKQLLTLASKSRY